MRTHGGPDFEFQRHDVVVLLVEALRAVTTALRCNDPSMTSEEIVVSNAIVLAQAQIPWMEALSISVILNLFSALDSARANCLSTLTKEDRDRDAEKLAGTNAFDLWEAVDEYSSTVKGLTVRYNWTEDNDAEHMATVASAMFLADDQFGLDLPPLQIINSEEDRQRYMDEALKVLAAQEAEKREKAAKQRIADENTAPTQAGPSKTRSLPPLTWTSGYYLTDDSFGTGYDDSIDPWEADGHPAQNKPKEQEDWPDRDEEEGLEMEEDDLEMEDDWQEMEDEWQEMEDEWQETEDDTTGGDDMHTDTGSDDEED